MFEPLPLGFYRHFKGKLYEIVGTGVHTETLEPLVIYRPCYKLEDDLPAGTLFVRPLENFKEQIERDGKIFPRFTFEGTSRPI